MKPIKFNDFVAEIKGQRKEIDTAIDRVLKSGWFILGQEVINFEKEFSSYLGVRYCIGTASGLEAIQIALMSLEIGVGDEVITTPLSAVATTLSIIAVGAKPVFVDVDENGQLDVNLIEAAITSKTKAVLPVHLYGLPDYPDGIKYICKKYKLYFIEDACQAHGSNFNGKKLGTFGDVGCFSFYPTKNLGALGDGGLIATNSSSLASLCYQIRDYGQKSKYIHQVYGLNSRLDEIQAAMLRVKLTYLDKANFQRQQTAQRYIERLGNLPLKIIRPAIMENSNFHLFVIKTAKRDQLQQFLINNKIPALIHYPKIIPEQPFLRNKYDTSNLPLAKSMVKNILSLPCHPLMIMQQVDYVCQKIQKFYN